MGGMAECSKKSRRPPTARLLLATLMLMLVGCAPRHPKPEPASTPAQQQPGRPPTTPVPAEANAEVNRSLAAAADLFNRGENDLACEQVASAERWQRNASTDAPSDLERFRQACQTP